MKSGSEGGVCTSLNGPLNVSVPRENGVGGSENRDGRRRRGHWEGTCGGRGMCLVTSDQSATPGRVQEALGPPAQLGAGSPGPPAFPPRLLRSLSPHVP